MQILELCLYGKNREKRTIAFRLGKVNIITGKSKSGKSAVGDIIEYCMGGESCRIAAGVVRDTVQWYGLLLQANHNRLFVARMNPDPGAQTTSACYVEVGEEICSPEEAPCAPNTNTNGLEQLLTRHLGINENVHTPMAGESRLPLEANVRHALFYCFQSQDEIAARSSLFHRQSEGIGITSAIRDTLPYLLGAVDEEAIALATELRGKSREIRILKREVAEAEALGRADSTSAASLLAEAEAVGLVTETDSTGESDFESLYDTLKSIRLDAERGSPDLEGHLSNLQEELRLKQRELAEIRIRIDEAKAFMADAAGYSEEMGHQRTRLSSIGLFEKLNFETGRCPLCSGRLDPEPLGVTMMKQSIRELDEAIGRIEREKPQLRRFIDGQEIASDSIKAEIAGLKAQINGIYSQMREADIDHDLNARRAKVFGRISYWLENVMPIDEVADKRRRLDNLERRVREINSILENASVEDRVSSVLARIQNDMTAWACEIDMEHSGSPYRLDLKKLTVIADVARPVQLRDMGSASNWLGSHLLAMFGLHKYFVVEERPVPEFLFLDQPSQAYFPVGSTNDDDMDIAAVTRTYKFIRERTEELGGKMQVIVVDHADLDDEDFRADIIEDWRTEDNLVPTSWCKALSLSTATEEDVVL